MPITPDATDPKRRDTEIPELSPTGKGDYRGRFGFGRPAHGSDPDAQYEFGGPEQSVTTGEQPTGPNPDPDSKSRHND
jgi:hypothetical protein